MLTLEHFKDNADITNLDVAKLNSTLTEAEEEEPEDDAVTLCIIPHHILAALCSIVENGYIKHKEELSAEANPENIEKALARSKW